MTTPSVFAPQVPMPVWLRPSVICDGLLGQEDEWQDVEDGKVEPPTPKDDLDPSDLDEKPAYEQPAEQPQKDGAAGQSSDPDKLRQMEEKFARTVNIDKPFN